MHIERTPDIETILTFFIALGAVHYVIQTTRTDVDASETNDDDVMREITTNLFYEADDLTPGGRYSIVVFSVGVGNSINDDGSPPVRQQTGTVATFVTRLPVFISTYLKS